MRMYKCKLIVNNYFNLKKKKKNSKFYFHANFYSLEA